MIESGETKKAAEDYLQLNHKQKAIEDSIPIARKTVLELPFLRLTEVIIDIVAQSGITISESEVEVYLLENSSRIRIIPTETEKPITKTIANIDSQTRYHSNDALQLPNFARKHFVRVFVIDEWYSAQSWQQVKEFTYKAILDKIIIANLPKTCQGCRTYCRM